MARTYLLDAASGVKRTFWYSWDLRGVANTDLTRADDSVTRQRLGIYRLHTVH